MDIKQQILKEAFGLFMRYGIKSVSMDDLARKLGMSKKTIYQYVANKADLITALFEQQKGRELCFIQEAVRTSNDAIEELVRVTGFVMAELRTISPMFIYDLQKYYAADWKKMETSEQEHVFAMVKANLERGKREGVYRQDFSPDIITKIYVGKSIIVMDNDLFPAENHDKGKLFQEYMTYHIRGIASGKGLALLEQHLRKYPLD